LFGVGEAPGDALSVCQGELARPLGVKRPLYLENNTLCTEIFHNKNKNIYL